MATWWRYHNSALNNPKVQNLPPPLFKVWVNLLCIASDHGGKLPPPETIAFLLRSKVKTVVHQLVNLEARRLLECVDGVWTPHDWSTYQYTSDQSNQRVKRHRDRYSNGHSTVTVTPPDTDTESDTDTEQKEVRKKERKTEKIRADSGYQATAKEDTASRPPAGAFLSPEVELFRQGKALLGANAGGMIAKLKTHEGGAEQALIVLERASTKENPREYIGRVLAGPDHLGWRQSGAII